LTKLKEHAQLQTLTQKLILASAFHKASNVVKSNIAKCSDLLTIWRAKRNGHGLSLRWTSEIRRKKLYVLEKKIRNLQISSTLGTTRGANVKLKVCIFLDCSAFLAIWFAKQHQETKNQQKILLYLFDYKPRLIKSFFILSCGLSSGSAYNQERFTFFISLPCRKVEMTLSLSSATFCRPNSLFAFNSL